MKTIELDLREVPSDAGGEWADHPGRVQLESAALDFAGKVVVVRMTKKRRVTK